MLLAGALSITPMLKLLSNIGFRARDSRHILQACLVASNSIAPSAAFRAFARHEGVAQQHLQ